MTKAPGHTSGRLCFFHTDSKTWTMPMKIVLNGKTREFENISTVSDLIREVGAGKGRIAVLVNEDVVLTGDRETHPVTDGDRIEIIAFAAGG